MKNMENPAIQTDMKGYASLRDGEQELLKQHAYDFIRICNEIGMDKADIPETHPESVSDFGKWVYAGARLDGKLQSGKISPKTVGAKEAAVHYARISEITKNNHMINIAKDLGKVTLTI